MSAIGPEPLNRERLGNSRFFSNLLALSPLNPLCQPFSGLVISLDQHDALRGMGLVAPEHQESNQYAIALETGAEGKTDLVTHSEAGPGHQDGERFLTIKSLLQSKGRRPKKIRFLAWMSHGLNVSCGERK